MDRDHSSSQRSRRKLSRIATGAAAIAVAGLGIGLLQRLLSPHLDRDEIRTAVVERGDVMASISAAGQVVPAREQVVSALFASEVVEIIATAGTRVEEDDPILALDSRALELAKRPSVRRETIAFLEKARTTPRWDSLTPLPGLSVCGSKRSPRSTNDSWHPVGGSISSRLLPAEGLPRHSSLDFSNRRSRKS